MPLPLVNRLPRLNECAQAAVFLYDFNSPYAYLAAARVDEVLPVKPRWQPIAFAFVLRAHNRSPWSFDERERRIGIVECERRAGAYGLPMMRWPPGWPIESYGLTSLRAAIVAERRGLLREFSRAAFSRNFVHGLGLKELGDVLAVAEEIGLDQETFTHEVSADDINGGAGAGTGSQLSKMTWVVAGEG